MQSEWLLLRGLIQEEEKKEKLDEEGKEKVEEEKLEEEDQDKEAAECSCTV